MLVLGVCLPQPWTLAARLTRGDHVWISTNNLLRFHNNEFDEMPWKLDSTKYASSFQTKPNPALTPIGQLHRGRGCLRPRPLPKNEEIALLLATNCWYVVKCVSQERGKKKSNWSNKKSRDTILYSLVYSNSNAVYIRLKYVYSIMSVKIERLPGNTKNQQSTVVANRSADFGWI